MTIHMLRLAVGAESLESMRRWREEVRFEWSGRMAMATHTSRAPRRAEELLDGGSLYWVVKGILCCRQRFIGFEAVTGADGTPACRMLLDPELVETQPVPRRPFQGWRYLKPEDAPPDLGDDTSGSDLPPHLLAELRSLGLA